MKFIFFGVLVFITFFSPLHGLDYLKEKPHTQTVAASVLFNDNTQMYVIEMDKYDETAPAYAKYTIDMENSGWDRLAISSYLRDDNRYSDEVKSYAMGYLEGVLTWKRIWNHFQNSKRDYFFGKTKDLSMPETIKTFLLENREWIKEMSKENKAKDPFWFQANLIYIQFEALLDGYNSMVNDEMKIPLIDAFIMNSADLGELAYYKNPSARPDFEHMSWKEIEAYIEKHSSCSALIKIASDFSDVWFGHATWSSYGSMTRIFKEYRFKSQGEINPNVVAMSSYPGAINSIDDFYITEKDLYITETTNSVFKKDLYDQLTPKSLLTWHRTMIANRLADSGKTWTEIFAKYNSGTYNNQWQILDLKMIDITKKTVDDGALYILEQMPGFTETADVTNMLRYGYWPSYNSAYFLKIREKCGYNEALEKNPQLKDSIDYYSCTRANIFRRDQSQIDSLEGLKIMLRYNNYKGDQLTKFNPKNSIAGRKDLDLEKPVCMGAIDAKVASMKDIQGKANKIITLISGPTTQGLEPFNTFNARCSEEEKGRYIFQGIPAIINFKWIEYETTLFNH